MGRQEEKDLLLKDLCARLPYGVIISVKDIDNFQFDGILQVIGKNWCRLNIIDPIKKAKVKNQTIPLNHIYIKPYLRPMTSMTEDEKSAYLTLRAHAGAFTCVEWLDKNHFDHRTNMDGEHLIQLHLALEAPEGMYNNS